MQDFFSGVNFIYLITLATAAISGWYGYSKYRYEKKLEKFKETNTDLFNKEDKQLVLAAIATLSIFKKDKQFEKNVTDVLLSRLYTELDYDVTNAIGNALLQYSNRNELIEIASKILEINRNFFVQTNPIKQRGYDIDKMMSDLSKLQTKADITTTDKSDIALETKLDMARKSFQEALKVIFPKQQYELLWHKQTTADTYAMIIRRAHLEKVGKGLDIQLYQNDFNYVYMAQFKTSSCSLIRSALSVGVYADVDFLNISLIYQCYFQRSYFNDSSFVGGKMVDTTFDSSTFENVKFENIDFSRTTFYQCIFGNTQFINCKGLLQENFTGAIRKDDFCKFPEGVSVPLPPPPAPPESSPAERNEPAS